MQFGCHQLISKLQLFFELRISKCKGYDLYSKHNAYCDAVIHLYLSPFLRDLNTEMTSDFTKDIEIDVYDN